MAVISIDSIKAHLEDITGLKVLRPTDDFGSEEGFILKFSLTGGVRTVNKQQQDYNNCSEHRIIRTKQEPFTLELFGKGGNNDEFEEAAREWSDLCDNLFYNALQIPIMNIYPKKEFCNVSTVSGDTLAQISNLKLIGLFNEHNCYKTSDAATLYWKLIKVAGRVYFNMYSDTACNTLVAFAVSDTDTATGVEIVSNIDSTGGADIVNRIDSYGISGTVDIAYTADVTAISSLDIVNHWHKPSNMAPAAVLIFDDNTEDVIFQQQPDLNNQWVYSQKFKGRLQYNNGTFTEDN